MARRAGLFELNSCNFYVLAPLLFSHLMHDTTSPAPSRHVLPTAEKSSSNDRQGAYRLSDVLYYRSKQNLFQRYTEIQEPISQIQNHNKVTRGLCYELRALASPKQ